jgi:hypothetical protein
MQTERGSGGDGRLRLAGVGGYPRDDVWEIGPCGEERGSLDDLTARRVGTRESGQQGADLRIIHSDEG